MPKIMPKNGTKIRTLKADIPFFDKDEIGTVISDVFIPIATNREAVYVEFGCKFVLVFLSEFEVVE